MSRYGGRLSSALCVKVMNECFIEVERDSVCMGDDIDARHEYTFKLPVDATLNKIFEHLGKKNYLASVAGKNHSWEAIINNRTVAIFHGNSSIPEPGEFLSTHVSKYANNGKVNVNFKYNSAAT